MPILVPVPTAVDVGFADQQDIQTCQCGRFAVLICTFGGTIKCRIDDMGNIVHCWYHGKLENCLRHQSLYVILHCGAAELTEHKKLY
jgi:hypothetical protein